MCRAAGLIYNGLNLIRDGITEKVCKPETFRMQKRNIREDNEYED